MPDSSTWWSAVIIGILEYSLEIQFQLPKMLESWQYRFVLLLSQLWSFPILMNTYIDLYIIILVVLNTHYALLIKGLLRISGLHGIHHRLLVLCISFCCCYFAEFDTLNSLHILMQYSPIFNTHIKQATTVGGHH